MKNKKGIWAVLLLVVLGAVIFGVYHFLNRQDEDSTLTILEKQWIESNKNKIIDLGIVNNVPVFNYEGQGIFFDYLNAMEKATSLEFNKVSYRYGEEVKTDYAFEIVEKKDKNDIVIYQDYYVMVTKNNVVYHNLNELKDLSVGVLNQDLEKANLYLKDASNLSFKTYETVDKMVEAITEGQITAMLLPKTIYLKQIVETEEMHISYHMTEYTLDYVIHLGDNQRLNTIMKKYYQKWANENYDASFAKHFSNHYFEFGKIDEKEKVKFRSKRYIYGFVENAPYDTLFAGKLLGMNYNFMKAFSKIADVEISYKRYGSIQELVEAFRENKIDFFFDTAGNQKYDMDTYTTVSPYDEEIVILSHLTNNKTVNSVSSLQNETVMVLKSSKVAEYLKSLKIKVKEFDTVDDLVASRNKNSFMALDMEQYRYYQHAKFEKYKIDYTFTLNGEYGYTGREIKNNQVFNQYFDFYLSFINSNEVMNDSYNELLNIGQKPIFIKMAIIMLSAITIVILAIFGIKKVKPKRHERKVNLSKEDKLKYIDMLTSLKNRNYLNDNIEKWDESEIYPQTIIILDLNNVAYINDNYGHAEGDKVIKQAANILIKNQIANSDIIRTNGNEFLIYMVGYDEKQVVAYIRKLNKELKDLNHGFGAASGYSIITDAIKTIDDAVNEATLDMRNNKEEANN